MAIEKKKVLMNSFFDYHFNYCSLIWMCHSRKNNTKIKNLYERYLRLIYSDKKSSYEKLLEKDGSASILYRNIQVLATEMYKLKSRYTPKIFSDLFNQREIRPYNLRRHPEFRVPLPRTVYHASKSILYLGPKRWDILLVSFKEAVLLNSFKKLIKKWVPSVSTVDCVRTTSLEYVSLKAFHIYGVGYRTAGASRVESFVIIDEGFKPFIIITRSSI